VKILGFGNASIIAVSFPFIFVCISFLVFLILLPSSSINVSHQRWAMNLIFFSSKLAPMSTHSLLRHWRQHFHNINTKTTPVNPRSTPWRKSNSLHFVAMIMISAKLTVRRFVFLSIVKINQFENFPKTPEKHSHRNFLH